MRFGLRIFFVIILGVFVLSVTFYSAWSQDTIVSAKIGIQIRSGNTVLSAKSKNDLNMNDRIRIYVHPEETSHIYIIHSDFKEATLLNMLRQKPSSPTLVMPSLQEFYQFDGTSPVEIFSIIISPDSLPEVNEVLKNGTAAYKNWIKVEESLIEKNKIDLSQMVEKPFSISGNVRGGLGVCNADPFVNELHTFSGDHVLVKRYEFRIKK